MKVTLKFYHKDPSLPSYPIGRNEPNSGQVIPANVEVGALPQRGCMHNYGGKDREVIMVTTLSDPAPGDPVAVVLVD